MRTLLLADESITTQRVVALTFADEAFRVVTVSDGQQALEVMAAARPDIVLAGTTLPRTNGYELSTRMQDIEALRDVPVLLLSGAFETVDAAMVATCGARGIIEKPLEPIAVIRRVRELLGLKGAGPAMPAGRLVTAGDMAADARQPVRAAAPPSARAPHESSWDEVPKETGFAPDPFPAEAGPGAERYLQTLDAAFDSLDQHVQQRDFTAEVGIHDVELPAAEPVASAPAPAEGLEFDFGLEDHVPVAIAVPEPVPDAVPVIAPPPVEEAPGSVADDFAALLAFETGDGPAPSPAATVAVQAAAPEVTDEMLDRIAQRVVERLHSACFGADLREVMAASVRETVRSVVSETSERLVRDEIARIKARAGRDTQ